MNSPAVLQKEKESRHLLPAYQALPGAVVIEPSGKFLNNLAYSGRVLS
jgi:hypothetical protein